ncbi:AMP-binding protein [Labedaea rhizosphaerae]|uniref:Fatty-acyl-CoA synthase n=1 Tax=Labedaea rhizosphaerae TaxID=598644 RepID=A0A4R6SQN5_LABRH|nr:AMP-binding protein [Labedaea rhizosphaerae]TDQ05852.1 fatty-acyl-CoA synthase [Labedaea rhizosphaerae]
MPHSSTATNGPGNASAAPLHPDSASPFDVLLDAFRRNADRVALIDGDESITYAQLLDKMFKMARALQRKGLRRGDGVAAIDDNTPGILLTYLATKLIGCYFVAVPAPAAAVEQLRILEFTGVSALVYEPSFSASRVTELASRPTCPEPLSLGPGQVGTDLLALTEAQSAAPFQPLGRDDDFADVVLTGGSSGGKPKAAAYTFERVAELCRAWERISAMDTAEAAAFRAPDCRVLRVVRATVSPGIAVLPTLLNGGTLLLQTGFDAEATLRAIEQQRVTVLALYPSHLYQLLDHPDTTRIDRSSVRMVVYWGAPMSTARLKQAIDVFGPVMSQIYGQSETRMVSHLSPEDHARGLEHPNLLRSVGRPRPGVEVEIRTATGELAAPGEIGEIRVRNSYRMNRYWNEPALTARTMVDGWSHTGDLAHQDADGYLYLADRLRDMVLVNAVNCYTVDIENVLTAHQAVRAACVVGLPDARTGEAVHAAVVRRAGAEVGAAELRRLVRDELGDYETPKSVLFVDELPVTRAGKPDKNTVRDLVSASLAQDG